MLTCFSKPLNTLLEHKQTFFSNNSEFLEKDAAKHALFESQPMRAACKLCCEPSANAMPVFSKHGRTFCASASCSSSAAIQQSMQHSRCERMNSTYHAALMVAAAH